MDTIVEVDQDDEEMKVPEVDVNSELSPFTRAELEEAPKGKTTADPNN